MSRAVEPTVFANEPLWLDILQQSIFCLVISMAALIRTTKIHEIVPIRRTAGWPGNEENSQNNSAPFDNTNKSYIRIVSSQYQAKRDCARFRVEEKELNETSE